MRIRVANGPVSWGVDYANAPANPPWSRVLDEIRRAGYTHLELGPVGYLPEDADTLRGELAPRGLQLTAGFVFDHLADPEERDRVLAHARRACATTAAAGGTHFVLINHLVDERRRVAGQPELGRRLRGAELSDLLDGIRAVADLARRHGLRPLLHPHAGTYVEYRDEIDLVLDAIPSSELGLCLDTGHAAYAGIDPIGLYRDYADRIDYLHLKDIDTAIHAQVLARRLDFDAAVAAGVFCPLDRGITDFAALQAALREHDFDGVATVEQDIDPHAAPDPLADAVRSLTYLRSLGFTDAPAAAVGHHESEAHS